MSCTRTRGKKGQRHADAHDPPRRRANKRRGHGTYETDRPPIFSVVSRRSGEVRFFVRERSDAETCLAVVQSTVPAGVRVLSMSVSLSAASPVSSALYTDEWNGYGSVSGLGIRHGTVRHGRDETGQREWARDDDGDGIREVHCNTCEGAGTGLRTFLRLFRGVHKFYLADYVATYETMINAKRITPDVLRRMCLLLKQAQTNYT